MSVQEEKYTPEQYQSALQDYINGEDKDIETRKIIKSALRKAGGIENESI